jgi:hypothetical protein
VGEKYCLRKTFNSNGRKGVTKVDNVFVIRKKWILSTKINKKRGHTSKLV